MSILFEYYRNKLPPTLFSVCTVHSSYTLLNELLILIKQLKLIKEE